MPSILFWLDKKEQTRDFLAPLVVLNTVGRTIMLRWY